MSRSDAECVAFSREHRVALVARLDDLYERASRLRM